MITDKEELLYRIRNLGFASNKQNVMNEISDELKKDNEVIFELIKYNQSLVNDFSNELIENPELMDKVFNGISSELYHRLSPDLKNNEKFMLQLLKYDTNAAYNLGADLRKNMEFMQKAAELNSETVYFASSDIKQKLEEKIIVNHKKGISFEDEIKEFLGDEKFKLVSNYPETVELFKKIKEQNKLHILSACMKKLNEQNLGVTEWTRGMENMLNAFSNPDYEELLSNIDINSVDIDTLYSILQKPNYYNIKSQEQLSEYGLIKANVCNAIVNGDSEVISNYPEIASMNEIKQNQFAVLQKHFNIDVNEANNLCGRYGDIDEIDNKQSKNLKAYIGSVIKIMKTKSKSLLEKMYMLEPVMGKPKDILRIEGEIKKVYAKEFNKTLFSPEQGKKISDDDLKQYVSNEKHKDITIVDAGTDFNMIITSIGAYSTEAHGTDYYSSWNRELTGAQGVSCSYIGNDMRGTAAIPQFCYGFKEMSEESLLMAGSQNLGSTTDRDKLTLRTVDRYLSYSTPENLKNYTGQYNEMVYSRMQEGKRKQPDYIVVFKERGDIKNMSLALKAVNDFRANGIDLPIVVVDTEKCKASEKERLDDLIREYGQTKDSTLAKAIEDKIKRNSVTDYQEFKGFWLKLDKERNNGYEPIQVSEYKSAYEHTSAQERNSATSKIRNLYKEVSRIAEELEK